MTWIILVIVLILGFMAIWIGFFALVRISDMEARLEEIIDRLEQILEADDGGKGL